MRWWPVRREMAEAERVRDEAHAARVAAEQESGAIREEARTLSRYGQRNHFAESLLLAMSLRARGDA